MPPTPQKCRRPPGAAAAAGDAAGAENAFEVSSVIRAESGAEAGIEVESEIVSEVEGAVGVVSEAWAASVVDDRSVPGNRNAAGS